MKDITLPSGAKLSLGISPFVDSRELYQIASKELIPLKLDVKEEIDANFFKNVACSLLSSKEFEEALWKCFEKCLYNRERITEETFEPEKAREDYLEVCYLVAKANVSPFMNALMQKYSEIIKELLQD